MTHRTRFAIATACIALLVASAPGCGKDSNPTGVGGGTKELNSGPISGGSQFGHMFSNAGAFPYCCTIHGCVVMSGTVTVANGNPTSADVNIIVNGSSFAFSPTSISVAPTGTVTWHNMTGTNHNVTSN
jgi:plastocyanin